MASWPLHGQQMDSVIAQVSARYRLRRTRPSKSQISKAPVPAGRADLGREGGWFGDVFSDGRRSFQVNRWSHQERKNNKSGQESGSSPPPTHGLYSEVDRSLLL